MLIKNRYIFSTLILSSTVAVAADLNPSAGPADTLSYTLQDICNRLGSGEEGTQRNFTEPTSGPAANANSTDCTLNEVMEKAPAVTGEAAEPDDVRTGKKYWGLTDGGNWGIKTGSSTAIDTSSGNATANDIKEGKIAWVDGKKVVGTSTAVDTSSGDATANEIKEGQIAWVDGEEVVGTVKLLIICKGRMNGSKRWCDNKDGTVTDMTTGLVWLKKANWGGRHAFACKNGIGTCTTIFDRVSELDSDSSDANLNDRSSKYGIEWRIPTLRELRHLAGDPERVRSSEMRAFSGVHANSYWSSGAFLSSAWFLSFSDKDSGLEEQFNHYYVWPVRNSRP